MDGIGITAALRRDNWRFQTRPLPFASHLLGFPVALGAAFLTDCIVLLMLFYNLFLKIGGHLWTQWSKLTTKLVFPNTCEAWSNPFVDNFEKDNPVETFHRPRTKTKPKPTNRAQFLACAFAALSGILTADAPFQLTSDLATRNYLRKYRGYKGVLQTQIITGQDLVALQQRLKSSQEVFAAATSNNPNAIASIADTGCSACVGKPEHAVPGSLQKLPVPIQLGGIVGNLPIEWKAQGNFETIDVEGGIFPVQPEMLVSPEIGNVLISPQALLTHISQNLDDHFRIYANRAEWHMNDKHILTMNYDNSFLPRLILFPKGKAIQTMEALTSVVHSSNTNLTAFQKIWLRWHNKLGHLGFEHVQKLGLGGFLDRLALGLNRTKVSELPQCGPCRLGKMTRVPDKQTLQKKNPAHEGKLIENQLIPGSRIFCDQLESRVRGRLLHTAGREPESDRFCGATVFYDAASGYIHVEPQVSLNASDTINAKMSFERKALEMGVVVDSYHTDNGIFNSKAFIKEIHDKSQAIRFSGVGAKWQNGAAENAIRMLVSRARTMMIDAAMQWPEADDASLWPLAVLHAAYLYNHVPKEESGIAPIEIFASTKSDLQALRNAHPWGCPAYVLEPRLTSAGGKIPKWQPRSRRGQYVGVSPVHAESISLIRNMKTGYISPQYHIVFDDWFETVYASESEEPACWDHLCTFERFEFQFYDDEPPDLKEEWLTPEEITQQRARKQLLSNRSGRKLFHEQHNREAREDLVYETPTDPLPREPPAVPPPLKPPDARQTREPPPLQARRDHALTREPTDAGNSPAIPAPSRRYPARNRQQATQLDPTWNKNKTYGVRPVAALCGALLASVTVSPMTAFQLQQQALGFDLETGFQEWMHPGILQSPMALKAKKSSDPDLPSTREALSGPHAEEFWKSMDKEIYDLESKETWEVVERRLLPPGTHVVPGHWAQRIKRLPSGQLNKFKSRWCFRGDLSLNTDNNYSPLVGWPTVRASLILAASHGWTSRQVDFTNAFCQSPQKGDVYMELPQYYRPAGCEDKDVVLKLKKSLYGQLDSPKLFYEHLCKGMLALGFQATESDPCLFIHKEHKLMVLNYCDDQIWLSPDNSLIEKYVGELQQLGYDLTLEPEGDMFGFLGIEFKREGSTIKLLQKGLIEKVIKYTGLRNASSKPTPAAREPLGSDPNGEPFKEDWNYAAAVGMLLYVSSNTRPDIQFAVHQAARFSHCPKKSHAQAVKRIVRYLVGTADKGILFEPNLDEGLDTYVDADFAGLYGYEEEQDPVSVKSRTGYVLTLFGCPIIWASKLQTEITLSSTAAEYVAFSMAMRELLPMRALLHEISVGLDLPFIKNSLVRSTVFEDNQGCLSLVNVPKMSSRNKYLALKYHFFRSHIGEEKGIIAKYIRTTEQKADILTKGLPEAEFKTIRKLLMGW